MTLDPFYIAAAAKLNHNFDSVHHHDNQLFPIPKPPLLSSSFPLIPLPPPYAFSFFFFVQIKQSAE